jgi:hypothetical protein
MAQLVRAVRVRRRAAGATACACERRQGVGAPLFALLLALLALLALSRRRRRFPRLRLFCLPRRLRLLRRGHLPRGRLRVLS